jgi:adenylate kinase
MLNLVLFGPPGAGKGTQSNLLIKKYDLIHLSTGDILRAEIKDETALGLKAKILMDKGHLVGDDVVIEMMKHKIEANINAKGFIFDGFPRTTPQAEALDELMKEENLTINQMISLEVPNEELIERLLLRGRESGRPDDANPEIIKNRIEQYNLKTAPVASYYRNQGKFSPVNGTGTVEDIFNRICGTVDSVVE